MEFAVPNKAGWPADRLCVCRMSLALLRFCPINAGETSKMQRIYYLHPYILSTIRILHQINTRGLIGLSAVVPAQQGT